MARQQESPLVSAVRNLETFDRHAWERQWRQERAAHPVYLKVDIPAHLHADAQVSVIAFTEPHPGIVQTGQWQLCLVGEMLSAPLAARLAKALLAIKHCEGLDLAHGVALLVQHYLYDVDWRRAAHLRAPSFFTDAPWESLQGTPPERLCLYEDIKSRPRWELSALLDFYRAYLEELTCLGFGESPNGMPGFPDYRRIPPAWIPLSTAPHGDTGVPTPPVALIVEATSHDAPSPENVAQHSPQGTQEGFKHSADFRSVSLRGQEFVLTRQQAGIIRLLYEAYQQGTPALGQRHLLDEIESPSLHLRYIFKSSPEAWKTLIVPGKKKGTYRLAL